MVWAFSLRSLPFRGGSEKFETRKFYNISYFSLNFSSLGRPLFLYVRVRRGDVRGFKSHWNSHWDTSNDRTHDFPFHASASGVPVSRAPTSGAPVSEAPGSGAPTSGTSASGTPTSGAPASGAPGSGTPTSGAPVSGTPASGTPVSGTPGHRNGTRKRPTGWGVGSGTVDVSG